MFKYFLQLGKLSIVGALIGLILFLFQDTLMDFTKKSFHKTQISGQKLEYHYGRSEEISVNLDQLENWDDSLKISNMFQDIMVSSNISSPPHPMVKQKKPEKKKVKKTDKISYAMSGQFKKFVFAQRNEAIRNMFVNRTDKVEKVCQEEKVGKTTENFFLPKAYSLEPLEKLLICRTAKHGSTTWAKNFIHIYLGKKSFKKGPKVYQRRLEEIEEKAYTREQKIEVIKTLSSPSHEYLSFFVCRNPIEKLVSVYKYMKDLKNRPDFQGRSHPSWDEYIRSVVTEDNYLGLTRPLTTTCNLCRHHYDAVIKMETYTDDSRKILNECGLGWVVPTHTNDHGTNSLTDHNLKRMFTRSSAKDILGLVDKYRLDFKFCGYEETMETLKKIAKSLKKKELGNSGI